MIDHDAKPKADSAESLSTAGLGVRHESYEFQGVEYLRGSAGGLILACPKCGYEHFREPVNYFWSLVPENKELLDRWPESSWRGCPSWHKCWMCLTQMEPIRMDELENRWKPFWRSLGHVVEETPNASGEALPKAVASTNGLGNGGNDGQ